jgi:Carboxypeptidase regulatory-like domain
MSCDFFFLSLVEKIMRSGILVYTTLLGVCAYAQTRDTGAIFGSVTDSQGAAIHGAVLTLTSTSTSQARRVEATVSGQFTYASLPVGVYTLTAEHTGFSKQEKTGILLQANENVRVDMTLQVGDVKTTVAVVADAAQVDLRSATIKDTVDQQRVVELPLNGRNAADLPLP